MLAAKGSQEGRCDESMGEIAFMQVMAVALTSACATMLVRPFLLRTHLHAPEPFSPEEVTT